MDHHILTQYAEWLRHIKDSSDAAEAQEIFYKERLHDEKIRELLGGYWTSNHYWYEAAWNMQQRWHENSSAAIAAIEVNGGFFQ